MDEPYMTPWEPECDCCGRWATYEVRNSRGVAVGHYCEEHARERVTELGGDPDAGL